MELTLHNTQLFLSMFVIPFCMLGFSFSQWPQLSYICFDSLITYSLYLVFHFSNFNFALGRIKYEIAFFGSF